MLRSYTFPVHIECAACMAPIETILRATGAPISQVKTNLLEKTTTVELNISTFSNELEEKLRQALKDGEYWRDEEPITDELTVTPLNPPPPPSSKKLPLWLRWLLGAIGVISGLVMLGLMLSGIGLPFGVMFGLGIGSAALSLALGGNTIFRAVRKLFKSGTLDMDTLFAVGGLATIAVSIAHLFIPGLPMVFDAALLIFGFQHIGDAIKETLTQSVTGNITFRERVKTTIKVESIARHVPLEKIIIGSIICVPRGEIIPIDGIVLDDEISIYETLINGNMMPSCYKKNNIIRSGLRVANDNLNEFIRIKTTHIFKDSYLNRLDNELSQARNNTPKIVTLSDKALRYFIPAVIILAVISLIAVGFFVAPMIGIQCAIAVLVSACPCTLGLVVPLAARVGLAKAEQQQVIFKNAESLQAAEQIDAVVFDLNGTLTTGDPIVTAHGTLGDSEDFLSYVAALESHSEHAFSRAITTYANQKRINNKKYNFLDIRKSHNGISAEFDGKRLTIGNETVMDKAGVNRAAYQANPNPAQHITYVAIDNRVVGHFVAKDPLRPGALATVNELKRLGKEVHLCTGADRRVAEDYARLLGIPITNVLANCKNLSDDPTVNSKTAYIKALQAQGKKVAMIGDGGNDVIPMLTSNFSVAIKSSSSDELTANLADAVIDSPSLLPVIALFETAKQTVDNIKQNLLFSLSYNMMAVMIAGGVLIALGFLLNPGIGAALMILQTAIIMANVYRFKQQSLPHVEHAKLQSEESEICYTSAELQKNMGHVSSSPQPSPATNTTPISQAQRAIEGASSSAALFHVNKNSVPSSQNVATQYGVKL